MNDINVKIIPISEKLEAKFDKEDKDYVGVEIPLVDAIENIDTKQNRIMRELSNMDAEKIISIVPLPNLKLDDKNIIQFSYCVFYKK